MMKSGLMFTLISTICASAAAADSITLRCHPATQQRSTTDLEVKLDKSTEKVTTFSFWDEINTIFWSDEIIYWLAKGNYSETSPQLALAGFNTSTSQLIVKTISAGSFKDDVIAKMIRRDEPPLNCYRVGL